jgi:phage replication-related protein YjqB (UPF0714/DUF867 family)
MSHFDIEENRQRAILQDRLSGLNMDGFQQELNLSVANALGDREQVAAITKNLNYIKAAITAIQNRIDGIEPDPIVEPVTDPEAE